MSEQNTPAESMTGRTAVRLDDTDRHILAGLLDDGRVSIKALADKLHISRANAYTRINRLMAEEVITGFSTQLNPQRAGLGTSAYVTLTIDQNAWRDTSGNCARSPTSSMSPSLRATSTSWCWSALRTTRCCAGSCWSASRRYRECARPVPGWSSTRCGDAGRTGLPDRSVTQTSTSAAAEPAAGAGARGDSAAPMGSVSGPPPRQEPGRSRPHAAETAPPGTAR